MKTNMQKSLIRFGFATLTLIAIVAVVMAISNVALADTVTGTLRTGLNGTAGDGMDGVVITPPSANPTAGVYSSAQNVTLAATGASSIRYTTDGSTPTCTTGNLYTSAINITASTVIEAISCYPSNHSSTVASYQYGITTGGGGGNANSNPSGGSGGGGGGGGTTSGSNGNTPALFSKGDSNGDGKINIMDFVTLMANWNQTTTNNSADFNKDGKVDIMDFVTLMANWTN